MPKDISPSLLRTQSKVPSLFGKKGFVAAFTIFYTQASLIFWTRDYFPFNEVKFFPFNSISPKKISINLIQFITNFPRKHDTLHDMSRDNCGDKLDKSATVS